MKRFYSAAEVVADTAGGYAVHLDGKPVRTPGGRGLCVPSRALADAIAREWAGQGDEIAPDTMPFTRLANAVIDGVAPQTEPVVDAIARYAETDLLCYRAEGPRELVAQQDQAWQPILDWAEATFGIALKVTQGVSPVAQPDEALDRVRGLFGDCDPFTLASAHLAASLSGSALIALALVHGKLDAESAWCLSRIDEAYQIAQWGEDAEAAARDARRKADLAVSVQTMRYMEEAA